MFSKNIPVGIMQGRLVPKVNGNYQAFPLENWVKEFEIAASIGLECIEFIFDDHNLESNPLYSKTGINKIIDVCEATKIQVKSICADYFMQHYIHTNNKIEVIERQNLLIKIIENSAILGVKDIVIPCVDRATIKNPRCRDLFIENIQLPLKVAKKNKINLCLETDLDPFMFSNLIDQIDSSFVTINYDIGNSAANGYNIDEEFSAYGDKISDIHIKDRKYKGSSTLLGKGNVDFLKFFLCYKKYKIQNNIFIFQAYRDEEGVSIFKEQYLWFLEYIKKINQ